MKLDIPTLAIVVTIANYLQAVILFLQHRSNQNRRCLGWWTLGSVMIALGSTLNILREIPSLEVISIIGNNTLFIAGMAVFYVGVLECLGKQESQNRLIAFCILAICIAVYFKLVDDNLAIRIANFSIAVSIISFLISWRILSFVPRLKSSSPYLLAGVFLANGGFLSIRAVTALTDELVGKYISPLFYQTAPILADLIISTLWTFGFVLLINQYINEEYRETQANLDLIFNTSPDAVMITHLQKGTITKINDGYSTLTGFSREDVIGKTTYEVRLWKNTSDRDEMLKILVREGFCENMEVTFRRKDGSLFNGLMSAKVITLQGVPHIISVTHDVTKLRGVENKFRMLFELSPLGLSMVDNETGKYLEANNAFLRMTGYTKEEIFSLSFWDLTPEEYRSLETEQLRQLNEAGRFGPVEKEYIRKDGSRVPVSISGAIYKTDDGKQVNWGIIEDITERKHAEAEKQKADKWLRTLLMAIEQSPVTTVVTDLDGNIVYVNPKFAETTGYTADEALGKNPRILKGGDLPKSIYKKMWKTILSGQSWHGTFHNQKKNGDLYWESAVISPVKDIDGTITHFLAVKEDITERKKLEEELKKQATTDELTGIFNRRTFNTFTEGEIKRAIRFSHPLSIAIVDIDHFKNINDTFGHIVGDQMLKKITEIFMSNIREIDLFARFGGDEFVLLFPETGCEYAYTAVDRIRQKLASQPISIEGESIQITISSGISFLSNKEDILESLIDRADRALYKAKEIGRNCVVVA